MDSASLTNWCTRCIITKKQSGYYIYFLSLSKPFNHLCLVFCLFHCACGVSVINKISELGASYSLSPSSYHHQEVIQKSYHPRSKVNNHACFLLWLLYAWRPCIESKITRFNISYWMESRLYRQRDAKGRI